LPGLLSEELHSTQGIQQLARFGDIPMSGSRDLLSRALAGGDTGPYLQFRASFEDRSFPDLVGQPDEAPGLRYFIMRPRLGAHSGSPVITLLDV